MKLSNPLLKLLLLLLLVIVNIQANAQDTELLENSWFIHSARANSSSSFYVNIQSPFPELRFELIFQADKLIMQGCCGGVLEMDVTYISDNQIEINNLNEIEIIACENGFVSNFYQAIKGALNNMEETVISFDIQHYDNMFGVPLSYFNLSVNGSVLEIYNIPNEPYEEAHFPYLPDDPNHVWNLTQVNYQGEEYELPYGAALSSFDIYTGTLEVNICGTLESNILFGWESDGSGAGACSISCGIIGLVEGNCDNVEGIDEAYLVAIKQAAFDFLTETINESDGNEQMGWLFSYVNGTYRLIISNYGVGSIWFHSNANYLSAPDFTIQNKISLYPNPATTTVTIEGVNATLVEVFSLSGKKVLESYNTNTVDIRQLANSLYLVKVYTNLGVAIKKLVKQ